MTSLSTCDGPLFRKLFVAGARWLAFHRDELNEMNIFPVQDCDTGTNMYLTLRSAVSSFKLAKEPTASGFLKAISRGAVMGARGSSGMILSQMIAGFTCALGNVDRIKAEDLPEAFRSAEKRAYRTIHNPREGTILSVISAIARSIEDACNPGSDLVVGLEYIHKVAEKALKESRDQLPELKEADLYDAGGQGLVYLLEGMLRAARFESVRMKRSSRIKLEMTLQSVKKFDHRYCAEYIIEGKDFDVEAIKMLYSPLGNSLVVAVEGEILKIHIHTNFPNKAHKLSASLGEIIKSKVEDMTRQHTQLLGQGERNRLAFSFDELRTALACVVNGEGLMDVFEGFGAYIIPAGKALNPSVEEVVEVLEKIPARDILLLPNNSECISVCDLAAGIADRNVYVIPTTNQAQGLFFLNCYDPSLDVASLTKRFFHNREEISTVEIGKASRDGLVDNFKIEQGEWMAFLDGLMVDHNRDLQILLDRVIRSLDLNERRRLTIIEGKDGIPDVHDIIGQFREKLDVDVDFIYGGQNTYPMLMGIE